MNSCASWAAAMMMAPWSSSAVSRKHCAPLPGSGAATPPPPATEVPAAAAAATEAAAGHGRKALIVTEAASVRELLARYLSDHGFTVAQVSHVVDGRPWLRK